MMKSKLSGPAIFMYSAIAVMIFVSSVCFILHYGKIFENDVVLWVGIVSFMILYHFLLRILMGKVTKRFSINFRARWFAQRKFEKKLYKFLRVQKWKDKVLTFEPENFSFGDHTYEQLATTMSKSELDHWINEIISVTSILFSLLWGQFWIFLLTAAAAMVFDAQFIVVQRFNRPKLMRLIEKEKRLKKFEKGEKDGTFNCI